MRLEVLGQKFYMGPNQTKLDGIIKANNPMKKAMIPK